MPAATPTPTPARRRPGAALALAAATAALAAGCGGGGSSPVSATSPAAAPAATPTTPTTPTATATTPATTPATAPATTPATAGARPATPRVSPPPPRATAPAPVRIAACASRALRATVGGPTDGAAGTTSFYLYLTNTGPAACTLSGQPGLSYVTGADGHQVGLPATREGAPRLVTLEPGGTAHARIRATNPGSYDEAQCQPVPVTGYRVYPPDQTAALFVREAGTACSVGGVSVLMVGPVVAGRPAQPGAF